MTELTANQRFHLLLGDIAMAMAIATYDRDYAAEPCAEYTPGSICDLWLSQVQDEQLKRRVCALANAGLGALQAASACDLLAKAQRYGVPMDEPLARQIAEHFERRKSALLTYRR